ncbi:MAG: hypothetical protein R3F62_18140 [Planctomycetota bacterium]
MAVWVCPACELRNESPGDCMVCGASLGSLRKAVAAASLSAGALALVWIACAVFVGVRPLLLALIYGAVVSGCVMAFSGGRGLSYQGVATAATIVGLLVADTVAVYAVWYLWFDGQSYEGPQPTWWEFLCHNALYEPYTIASFTAGVLGGLFLWIQPGTD